MPFDLNHLELTLLIFFSIVYAGYFIQSIYSTYIIQHFTKKRAIVDGSEMLTSEYLPTVALIAPAYNEEEVVLESVRSLLSIQYFNVELVIVNDGSKDNTLQILIDEFQLEKGEPTYYSQLYTKPIKGIYKSKSKALSKLTIVDKVNGRKADAINAGINVSMAEYYAVIDLDCILEPDTLLTLMSPVINEKEKKVVAVGGVVGVVNDCEIKGGKVTKIKTPETILPKIQVIEYFRSFILSRPAWNQKNGLLIISGALGLFERETLINVGGFSHDAIGEDMDLVIKIHKYCLEKKINYKVDFIPYPLCWTEVPPTNEILEIQRNRWMRGTIQCMLKYRKMIFNPTYGRIGMISLPYWIISEMCAPLIEFLGLMLLVIFIVTGIFNWPYAIMLFALIYCISILLSCYSIVVFYLFYNKYNTQQDLLQFLKAASLEPFLYHPRVLVWSLKGYYDYFIKKKLCWGEMKRIGFSKSKSLS